MLTCRKTYCDIPFAHRQHCHDGHCALVHGHNWTIHLTFACSAPDANGFVVDFGRLKYLKAWIDEHLDHACVLNRDDPERERLLRAMEGLVKPYIVPNCSCEGLCVHLHAIFDAMVREHTGGRAWISGIEIEEDSKNSATYRP